MPEPPKNLLDLPNEIKEMIIQRLNFREQQILRKTSKFLRKFVDNQKPACTRLSIVYQPDGVICGYDDYRVAYFSPGMEIEEFQAQNIRCHGFVQTDNYKERAFRDFEITLKNPRLRLEKLETSYTFYISQLLMEPINHRVFVRELDITPTNPSCLLLILPFLRPGVLNKITIRRSAVWSADAMHRVAELEQWKQAEELEMQYLFDRFPMEHARQFRRFKFEELFVSEYKLFRIEEFLSELVNFEQCILSHYQFSGDPDFVHELLGAPVSSNETEDVFHHPITGSNYYFELTWPKGTNDVIIEASSSDSKKPTEQPDNDLTEAMRQLTATSDKTSSTKNLSDMPTDVAGLIIERSNYKEQLKLRKVSKSLRALVDKQKPALLGLKIDYRPDSIVCVYNLDCIHYDSPHKNSVKNCSSRVECRAMISDDYEKIAFDDIAFTLKNPKLQLNVLYVDFQHQSASQYAKLREILDSIGHHLSAIRCNIEITRPSEYRSILPYLKPGVLEQITVCYKTQGDDSGDGDTALKTLKEVSLLEQWKKAEELDLLDFGYERFPMEYAKHFKRFNFQEGGFDIDVLNGYRDFVLTMDNFKYCVIKAHIFLYEDEFRYIWKRVGVPAARNDRTKYVSHYSIPNTDEILEFMFFVRDNVVTIEKKNLSKVMEEIAAENSKNSSKPSLSDMPDNVLGLIIERSDYKEQLILRKTSKSLRELVDKQKPTLTRLQVSSYPGYIQCHYNDEMKIYAEPDRDEIRADYGEDNEEVIESEEYEEIAFGDLAFTMKNPKLQLESLSVKFDDCSDDEDDEYQAESRYEELCDVLSSIDHLVSVKECNLDINCPGKTYSILPYLEPGVLEKITVRYGNHKDDDDEEKDDEDEEDDDDGTALDTLAEEVSPLQQWKQAKELELSEVGFDSFPMEYAEHFQRFVFNEHKIDRLLLIRIREYLSTLDNFEFCLIKTDVSFSRDDARKLACSITGSALPRNEQTEFVSRYRIPDSDHYLEFIIFMRPSTITIEKKKKPRKDRSKAAKQLSVTTVDSEETSTSSKSLSDMPGNVLGLIIERSKYKEQLVLRKVSKSLRAHVDSQKPACKSIRVYCEDGCVNIVFDHQDVMYTENEVESDDDDDDVWSEDGEEHDPPINVVRDDFEKAAFNDLASTLKNPKLQLEELCFEVNENMINNYNRIKCVLESLDHQVSVKETDLRMSSLSSFLSVLPYLKPGLLEKITLRVDEKEADWSTFSIGMDQVVLLEQWKQAKELELWDPFDEFPMKHAAHFKRFRIHLKPDGGKFARIKEFLSKMDNLELCTLSFNAFSPDDTRSVYELLGEPVSSNTTEEVFHHPIPNSDCFFEIKKSTDSYEICFHITKKMRKGNF